MKELMIKSFSTQNIKAEKEILEMQKYVAEINNYIVIKEEFSPVELTHIMKQNLKDFYYIQNCACASYLIFLYKKNTIERGTTMPLL